jgi:hypothetical protein
MNDLQEILRYKARSGYPATLPWRRERIKHSKGARPGRARAPALVGETVARLTTASGLEMARAGQAVNKRAEGCLFGKGVDREMFTKKSKIRGSLT